MCIEIEIIFTVVVVIKKCAAKKVCEENRHFNTFSNYPQHHVVGPENHQFTMPAASEHPRSMVRVMITTHRVEINMSLQSYTRSNYCRNLCKRFPFEIIVSRNAVNVSDLMGYVVDRIDEKIIV